MLAVSKNLVEGSGPVPNRYLTKFIEKNVTKGLPFQNISRKLPKRQGMPVLFIKFHSYHYTISNLLIS